MKSTVFTLVMLLCLSTVTHAARLDTSFSFSTIETRHFSIHFHQGLETIARKAAVIAEEAHEVLSPVFAWQPREKTEMVLIDDSDFTNGFAMAFPYNTITIQVVPPDLASTVGEYDDWLKTLITHEYAHILTMDPAQGYGKAMRELFGKPLPGVDPFSQLLFLVTAPPNIFLPRWWHEGMATWAETEYTGMGRGRGSYYDMIYRMAVAGGTLPDIARINGDVPEWPAGNLPYVYGYRLQQYIADTYGKDAPGKLNLGHAGRFPYFIGTPPRELSGKSYGDLYGDMIAALKREQAARISALSAVPFTPLRTLSKQGELLTNPRFSPDAGRIAFNKRDSHDHMTTVITDKSGTAVVAEFRRRFSDGSTSWSPDGRTLYFTQAEIVNGFNTYQDLYAYDLGSGSITRLTMGARLGDADLSPDGRTFAAVVSVRGNRNLVLLDRDSQGKTMPARHVTAFEQQRVASPRWSPDGAVISYTLIDNSGQSSIRLYDVASGKERTLFTVNHTAAYPVWSRDGSFLVYVSDETGVFNLFAYDLKEGKSLPVSHLLGGALQPDLSPDGSRIIFSSYDAAGFSIAELPLDRGAWPVVRPPSLPPPPAASTGAPAATPVAPVSAVQAKPYRSLPTLLPRFWLPRLSADGSDNTVLGIFTVGGDVLGYNSYALTADYSPGRNRGYFNLNYRNDYLYPTLFLDAHAAPALYSNLWGRGDYYELDQGFTVGLSVPVNALESRYRISAGYQLREQKALSAFDNSNGVSVFQGRRDNLFAAISYDNVLRYPYSVSSEEGRRISAQYRRFGRELGNERDMSEYSAEYQEFLRLPFRALQHQILYLRLAGALADSDQRYVQQSFQIGGVPSTLNQYPLRGYPERAVTGKYVATGTLEYRAPLFFPFSGSGTSPAFFEKVHGALFVDAGEVWDDRTRFRAGNLLVGVGAEARVDMTLGYWLKVTPAIGVARGLTQGGGSTVYFTIYMNL